MSSLRARIPMTLYLPRRELARGGVVRRAVDRVVRPRRSERARVSARFALSPDELRFARDLVDRHTHYWLYRCNQAAYCGDFVVVDMSAPDLASRRAYVLELKRDLALRPGGGEAGYQLRRSDEALAELARRDAVIARDGEHQRLGGSRQELLRFLALRAYQLGALGNGQ